MNCNICFENKDNVSECVTKACEFRMCKQCIRVYRKQYHKTECPLCQQTRFKKYSCEEDLVKLIVWFIIFYVIFGDSKSIRVKKI